MSGKRQPNLDSLSMINDDGSRTQVHPADVQGKFTILRRATAWFLVLIYVALPWIKIGGFPAVFLDLAKREFHFFGMTLLTSDMWLLIFLITGLAFALFVLSSVVGRVWCGWYCPYTVFMEHVYRRVERWIEGDSVKRKKLDKQPWNAEKIFKRGLKWVCYVLISLILANVFLSYFLSIPELWRHMAQGPAAHPKEFIFILAFTGVFTFMFGWFREQFCIILCPYGRFQSALTDDDTVTVAYDYKRGEPRGRAKKGEDRAVGDCVDCKRCINVCPTGIDIRNGIQLECVACSSCIDACNDIMKKLKKPTGLIRYDSLNGIETGKRRVVRPRLFLYAFFMLLGGMVMLMAFMNLKSFHGDVQRMSGSNYVSNDDGVRNLFSYEIKNKSNITAVYTIEGNGPSGIVFSDVGELKVESLQTIEGTITASVAKEAYDGPQDIHFYIRNQEGEEICKDAKFQGPNKFMYNR